MYSDNIKHFNEIEYIIGNHPEEVYSFTDYNKCEDTKPVPQEILDLKIREDESVEQKIPMVYVGTKPFLLCKFEGTTIQDWLHSLFNGVHEPITNIDNDTKQIIIDCINKCFRPHHEYTANECLEKLENNRLTPLDLMGNHIFFQGDVRLEDNIWTFSVGS